MLSGVAIPVITLIVITAVTDSRSLQVKEGLKNPKHGEGKRQEPCVGALGLTPDCPELGTCPGTQHPSKSVVPGHALPYWTARMGRMWELCDHNLKCWVCARAGWTLKNGKTSEAVCFKI